MAVHVLKATPNKFSFSHPPPASSLLSALNIPLFRILPLFSGYSSILTGSVKAILNSVSSHVSSAINSAQTSCLCYFCNLKRKEQAYYSYCLLLYSFLWLCQVNNGLKSCQSYNGNGPPAHMQICLSPVWEIEFIWSGLIASFSAVLNKTTGDNSNANDSSPPFSPLAVIQAKDRDNRK